MKIGIIYGSTLGNTADAADAIAAKLQGCTEVTVRNIGKTDINDLAEYDVLILGASTWGAGEIQDDWSGKEELKGLNLTGKKAAVFGCGDQNGFSDTFVDAMGILAQSLKKAGATLIGEWPTDGYSFSESQAKKSGRFVGLALDNDNQPEQTESRIALWTGQVRRELGI
jgi:flavodoxin I